MALPQTKARLYFVYDDEDVDDPIEQAKENYEYAFETLQEDEGYDGEIWNIDSESIEEMESQPNAILDVEARDHGISNFKSKLYRSFRKCEEFDGMGSLDKIIENN